MVLEQVRTGQMTGSQMTVRFCRTGAQFYTRRPNASRATGICWLLYLAAAGETLVVVRGPAGAVSVMLLLEETGLWVFLQLLRVFGEEIVPVLLLLLPPGPELTGVWHMDLEEHEG